jgi:hypothetical protein
MKNVINLLFRKEYEIGNVVLDEAVILVSRQVLDVVEIAGDQIVDRYHAVPFLEQTISQMRSKKASSARDNGNGFSFGGHGACYLPAAPKFSEQKSGEKWESPLQVGQANSDRSLSSGNLKS